MLKSFPFVKQIDSQDCGFACLKMVGQSYDKGYYIDKEVILNSNINRQGISIKDLECVAKSIGFETYTALISFQDILEKINLPAIFFWNQNHFVVVHKVTKTKIWIADPAFGKTYYTKDEFIKGWAQNNDKGIVLLLEPDPVNFNKYIETNPQKPINIKNITKYLSNHKTQLVLISFTLLLSSCIELILPFFTQKIIDKGVAFNDLSIIYLILASQLALIVSKIILEFYRSWLFIFISSTINLSLISDFLGKLLKLPISFFNSKNIGDIIQRIRDHDRVQEFLSHDIVQTAFSFFTVIIYSSVLYYFNVTIFSVVLIGTIIELIWIFSFFEKIQANDYKSFTLRSKDEDKIVEFVRNIQEIKLNNLEENIKNQWHQIQKNLYINNLEKLKIRQKHDSYKFISYIQLILIVFFAAISVMNKSMSIGSMLSVMFIFAGLNTPISNLINFFLKFKLVGVSFERLNEIHSKNDEENSFHVKGFDNILDITVQDLNFAYDNTNYVLKDINLTIPKNKTTAIVGLSGSGKTTLLKLLLKFYKPQNGTIKIGTSNINQVNNQFWRRKCGVILQDSAIFSDTIKYNVSLEENPDIEKLYISLKLTNIDSFVNNLPLKENTIIGTDGIGLSHGQRQRLLIARAIYKNPEYLFFDEATNSLDSENEKIIVNNIGKYFKNKTIIVVAHRLSTVKNADQIIVLDDGSIIERGGHDELVKLKGKYFSLVKNQLELGL